MSYKIEEHPFYGPHREGDEQLVLLFGTLDDGRFAVIMFDARSEPSRECAYRAVEGAEDRVRAQVPTIRPVEIS